ncbi:MAG: hypothetical protein OHK0038_05010 [Flammeovirgaceae bacterium]
MNLPYNSVVKSENYVETNQKEYLYDQWKQGEVFYNATSSIKYEMLKYNIQKDVVEMYVKDRVEYLYPSQSLGFSLKDNNNYTNVFVSASVSSESNSPKFYMELLSNGKTKLLLHRTINRRIVPGNSAINLPTKEVIDINKNYYVVFENNSSIKLKPNKKQVLLALGDKKKEIEDFIRNNQLKFNNTQHLIQIFNFYNSLVQ